MHLEVLEASCPWDLSSPPGTAEKTGSPVSPSVPYQAATESPRIFLVAPFKTSKAGYSRLKPERKPPMKDSAILRVGVKDVRFPLLGADMRNPVYPGSKNRMQ